MEQNYKKELSEPTWAMYSLKYDKITRAERLES